MADLPESHGPEALERLGIYDPSEPDASDRLELLNYLLSCGATPEDIAATANLGALALDLALRPRLPRTLAEVAVAAGIEPALAERLVRVAGFSGAPDERVTADEAATVEFLALVSEFLGEETAAQLARVAGSVMARLAEAIVAAFRVRFEVPRRSGGAPYPEVVKEYQTMSETMLPRFVRSLDAMLRRQIVAVAGRMWSLDEEGSTVTLERTVGFADIVGYTSKASSLTPRQLAAVLAEFEDRVTDIALRSNTQVVKMIGDEAMFVSEHANDACRVALDLVDAFRTGELPPVRVGLAAGVVVSIFGDYYGEIVNLAARLVAVAEPSTVVASADTRAASNNAFLFDELAPQSLKGFAEPVSICRVRR